MQNQKTEIMAGLYCGQNTLTTKQHSHVQFPSKMRELEKLAKLCVGQGVGFFRIEIDARV